jgi:FkbM family methyltransferase
MSPAVTYRIPLPEGGRTADLDLVDPYATAVQRLIRRSGLASFEPETAAALLTLFEHADPGFVFYDVGANVGVYSAMAAVMFHPEAVHSFEPSPITARMLRTVAEANDANITIHECALSDVDGTATLFLSPESDASNSLVEGFRDAAGQTTVVTRRLDDVVRETGVAPTVIKIDVETHEPAVLAGARKTLEAHRPYLVIEVLFRSKVDLGAPIGQAVADLGYSCYALDSEPDWQPADRITGRRGFARDWLLAPDPLSDEFIERWNVWHQRYLACDLQSNPRPPIVKSARRALERSASRQIFGTAWRFVSRELVPSFASSARRSWSRVVSSVRRGD